jgi:hypothetical protein
MLSNFFPLSLTTRPNKLEGLSLETLSSQVLEFEGKVRANPIGAPFRCYLLGKLLVLPANVSLDWKVIARYKHSSLFGHVISNEGSQFYNIDTRREKVLSDWCFDNIPFECLKRTHLSCKNTSIYILPMKSKQLALMENFLK